MKAVDDLILRHKFVPYIHTYNHLTHEDGRALIEPMYYEHANEEWTYRAYNEYYFGAELIVAPITKKGVDGIGCAKVKLPKGTYIDLFTRQVYRAERSGKTVNMYRGLGSIPILMKENSVIPLSEDNGNGCKNPKKMRVLVFGESATFTMIEDDGAERRLETTFQTKREKGNVVLTVQSCGNSDVSPNMREIVFEFVDMLDADLVSLREKGKTVPYEITKNRCFKISCAYSGDMLTMTICPRKTLRQERKDDLSYAKQNMLSVIEKYEGRNDVKEEIYNRLNGEETKEEFLEVLSQSKLPKIRKRMIEEFL